MVAGVANIAQAGNITNINQSSQNAVINWQSFNVGKHETVNFNQPNAQSVTLNRVIGNERSIIDGAMNANGKVFISNANGMLIGKDAKINVGSLVATTANISDEDFMSGRYAFDNAKGSIENLGHISVPKGGVVALIAPIVKNGGKITAPEGNTLLASAESFSITLPDNANFKYTLDKGTLQGLVDNGGAILADGGRVVLTAKGVDSVKKSLIKHSGSIEANTVQNKNGVIELLGDLDHSALNVSGSLKAEAKESGDGGFIETSAAQVKIEDSAEVSTLAENGKTGTWLIDPTDFNIQAGRGTRTANSIGAETLISNLQKTDIAIQTVAAGSENGNINVNAPVSWNKNKLTLSAHNDININANINGSGAAKLDLRYGQGAKYGGNSDYYIKNGVQINLPVGENLILKKGNQGDFRVYHVIHDLNPKSELNGKNIALGRDINFNHTNLPKNFYGYNTNSFHGLGHIINNFTINADAQGEVSSIGFIRYLKGGMRDVKFHNLRMTVDTSSLKCTTSICSIPIIGVGALAGHASDATIKNVSAQGKIKILNADYFPVVGGAVGYPVNTLNIINTNINVDIEKPDDMTDGFDVLAYKFTNDTSTNINILNSSANGKIINTPGNKKPPITAPINGGTLDSDEIDEDKSKDIDKEKPKSTENKIIEDFSNNMIEGYENANKCLASTDCNAMFLDLLEYGLDKSKAYAVSLMYSKIFDTLTSQGIKKAFEGTFGKYAFEKTILQMRGGREQFAKRIVKELQDPLNDIKSFGSDPLIGFGKIIKSIVLESLADSLKENLLPEKANFGSALVEAIGDLTIIALDKSIDAAIDSGTGKSAAIVAAEFKVAMLTEITIWSMENVVKNIQVGNEIIDQVRDNVMIAGNGLFGLSANYNKEQFYRKMGETAKADKLRQERQKYLAKDPVAEQFGFDPTLTRNLNTNLMLALSQKASGKDYKTTVENIVNSSMFNGLNISIAGIAHGGINPFDNKAAINSLHDYAIVLIKILELDK